MDRLSYKDGYLKGIYQSLNTLLEDGIISKKQWKDYKDKFFNDEIVVPEKYQFYNRNYINELKQMKNERNYMQKIIPLIKEIERGNIYRDYNFKNTYEMLVDGVGISKSSANEIILVSDYYYNRDGSQKTEWKDFETKSLIYLARCHKKGIMDIYDYRKINSINPDMKFEEIRDFANQFVDEDNCNIWDLLRF
ncbi:MAG: hypothetical protein HDQ97_03075 [Lachnospiraceae bacterium]|nr:hypothetical protein [Lachnospiraceae bacterium]